MLSQEIIKIETYVRLLSGLKYLLVFQSQVKQVLSSPTLSHSSKPLSNPLTNLSSPYHTSIAIRINKTLHEYADNVSLLLKYCNYAS